MSKEILKLSKPKQLKEILKNKKVGGLQLAATETGPVAFELPKEIIESPVKIDFGEKFKSFFEKKVVGAIKEVFRHKERDESIENNLSTGLDTDSEFVKADEKINKKRNWLLASFNNLLNRKVKEETQDTAYVFDESAKQAMKELEEELTDSFAKNVYNRMADINKQLLLDHLVDNPVSRDKSEIIELPNVSEANNNVVAFSDNGYLMQLTNKEDARVDANINIESEKAFYNLISPDGKIIAQNLNYIVAFESLKNEANNYQQKLKQEFVQQEIIQKNLLERERENNIVVEEVDNSRESEMNKLMDKMLEDEKENSLDDDREKEFSNNLGKEPVVKIEIAAAGIKNIDEVSPIKNDSVNQEIEKEEIKSETVFINPFNEKVSKYAESIGIKPEELSANQEFLLLSPEQQQFALEILHRSSLAKAKVEANETFIKEKASKKWWQIGFAMNQNFHKERHKIEAVKNIKNHGLEGYGETELNWLIEIIENGPEVKINDAGEVIVNCLHDYDFRDDQKEMIAEYNDVARNYIECKGADENFNLRKSLDHIRIELLNGATDGSEQSEINKLFLKSKNNIELLKFLSADQQTEQLLNKMADTSLTGFDKVKAMAIGQKDKAGYSALGFSMRTGAKFALANSAYLASALSYSVAPIAAAIVGGFRGYNLGKKELSNKDELAKLGVADNSDTAKSRNLAVGRKEGETGHEINFGLTEKLQSLMTRLNYLRNSTSYDYSEEIKKTAETLDNRINYTEKQINLESVDYGSVSERNVNYFNLINTLAEAKSELGIFASHYKPDQYFENYDYKNLGSYDKKINLVKGVTESEDHYQDRIYKYKKWSKDETRLAELSKISVADRLASFLNYKEDQQNKKEQNFLIKKVATGALMGAGFAAAGAFVAEQLGVNHWFSGKDNVTSNSGGQKVVGLAKTIVSQESKTNVEIPIKSETVSVEVPATPTIANHVASHVETPSHLVAPTETAPESPINKVVEIKTIDTPIEPVPVNKVVNTDNLLNHIETPTQVGTQNIPTDNVVETPNSLGGAESPEVVDAKNAAEAFKNIINISNRAAKLADGVYSNNSEFRTAESFIKQISDANGGQKLSVNEELEAKNIFDSFKQNNDYNILRKQIVDFEGRVYTAHANEVASINTVTENTDQTSTVEPTIKTPVNSESNLSPENSNKLVVREMSSDEIPEEVRLADIRSLTYHNNGIALARGLSNNESNFRTEEDFLKQISEINGGTKLSADEQLEAKSIYESFKQNNDYNNLREKLFGLEERLSSAHTNVSSDVITNPKNPVAVENFTEENINSAPDNIKPFVADKISIAAELHAKPEALEQVGNDLVYKGIGKSNIIFDLKAGGIKEAVDTNGKKIPNEFINELMKGSKLSKFTRGGGLEKIFTSWNKLGSNDKLIYESLNWFNKKTISPEDLLNQIKGVYQVKTENVFVDTLNKHFTTGNGRNFDMTLKGIKKLIAFLPKN